MKIRFTIKEVIEHQPIDIKIYQNFLLKKIKSILNSLEIFKREILEYLKALKYDDPGYTKELVDILEDEILDIKKGVERFLERFLEYGGTLQSAFDLFAINGRMENITRSSFGN